ncbi:UdgX family uracil-DNA binding protein [Saccharopolyspora sp. CA-218241]|uniref:UdgX family uracil-DNA binding protein n=1 Tax=Saccharopolyspora sp. CA-218241 TaxID=3240027 RepID=UPI003D9738B7
MPGAEEYVPPRVRLPGLRAAVQECRGCELYRDADRAVFGEGRESARAVVVGEQPGDQEDRAGRPFVGPAGRLFDEALAEVGIDRDDVYVTNATKHFRFQRQQGKRRIHQKPSRGQVNACRPWLTAELNVVRPEVVVCLGATAAQALLGPSFRVSRQRGELIEHEGMRVLATVHPSAVLRSEDDREQRYAELVADLRVAAETLRPE